MTTLSQLFPTLKPTKAYLVRNDTLTYPAHSSDPSYENSFWLFRLSTHEFRQAFRSTL